MSDVVRLRGESALVPVAAVHPNPWNPNRMTDEEEEALRRAFARHGQVAPIVVRWHPEIEGEYQIIDGQHRHQVLVEMGADEVMAHNLGEVPDPVAMHLNAVLTETRGESDQGELGALIATLSNDMDMATIAEALPYTEEQLAKLAEAAMSGWSPGEAEPPADAGDVPMPDVSFGPYQLPDYAAREVRAALDATTADDPAWAFYAAVTGKAPPEGR